MSLSWTIGGFIEVPESLLYSSFTSSQLPKGSFPLPLTEGTYDFIDIYLWLCIKTQATIQAPSAPIEMFLLNISKSTLASPGFPPPQYPWVLFIEARISLCPSSPDSHSLSPVPLCSHYVLLSLLLKIALPVSHPFFFSLLSPIYNKNLTLYHTIEKPCQWLSLLHHLQTGSFPNHLVPNFLPVSNP